MYKYEFGKFIYFDYLVFINSCNFQNLQKNYNIRCDLNEIILYNNLIKTFFKETENEQNIDKIIEKALNLVGFLWFRQPFFDGNTRTLRNFLQIFFCSINYKFEILPNEYFIPIFYSDDEKCNNDNILKIKRRLTKL